jgi:hypothetical protein
VFVCAFDLLAGGVLGDAVDCDFHNQPELLDSTETEKTTAANKAMPATSTGARCRFDLVDFNFVRKFRFREVKPGRFSLGDISKTPFVCRHHFSGI